jgi:hypothetical protein
MRDILLYENTTISEQQPTVMGSSMTKMAALIRTLELDENVRRLESELKPYFGEHIYFMVERYEDTDISTIRVEGKAVSVGRGFLEEHGLPWFRRVGWQCGDFMYYAAAKTFPDYDFFWLIESDVSIRADVPALFSSIEALRTDFLGIAFGESSETFKWHDSMWKIARDEIFKCFYPVSRLSRAAALHLLAKRTEYSALPFYRNETWSVGNLSLYPNDEVFTATVLMQAGFSCQALHHVFPKGTFSDCTRVFVIHPEELPFIMDKIVHPVGTDKVAASKLSSVSMSDPGRLAHLKRRMDEFSARLGPENWERFSGISRELIEKSLLTTPRESHLQELLEAIYPAIKHVEGPARLIKAWLFRNRLLVFDFMIDGRRIAFDLGMTTGGSQYQIEVLNRGDNGADLLAVLDYPQTGPGRYLAGEWPAGLAPADRTQDMVRCILDVVDRLNGAASRRTTEWN